LRSARRTLELDGHVLVGALRGVGVVPGASIWIDLRISDRRQGAMRVPLLLTGRRAVHRRADQRMTKPDLRAELDQTSLNRGHRRFGPDREALGCSPHEHGVADRIGRRDQQQATGLDGNRVESSAKALLDAARERGRTG